jgi:hypothetical protein
MDDRETCPLANEARERERLRIIRKMKQGLAEIRQMRRDTAYYNANHLPAGHPPIDDDPVGELARWEEWYVDHIVKMGGSLDG